MKSKICDVLPRSMYTGDFFSDYTWMMIYLSFLMKLKISNF